MRIELDKNKNGSGSYSFSENNYNAGLCGSGHNLTTSFTQGDPTYDAARTNMGEPWMMFTKVQGQELIDYTTYEWTSLNEINGGKFTSKTNPLIHIFLPAGGFWYSTNHDSTGSYGYYWSNKPYSSYSAWALSFYNGYISMYYGDQSFRGFSIRPIAPPKPW